jgi:hypothetical protein
LNVEQKGGKEILFGAGMRREGRGRGKGVEGKKREGRVKRVGFMGG